MRIQGIEITPAQIEACERAMKQGPFRAWHIALVASKNGVPRRVGETRFPASRLADALIQKQRIAGNIQMGIPYATWTWIGPDTDAIDRAEYQHGRKGEP